MRTILRTVARFLYRMAGDPVRDLDREDADMLAACLLLAVARVPLEDREIMSYGVMQLARRLGVSDQVERQLREVSSLWAQRN